MERNEKPISVSLKAIYSLLIHCVYNDLDPLQKESVLLALLQHKGLQVMLGTP